MAGLLGPNGAGKTTCFYMITGLIAADYGAIYLDGENITGQPMYQRARMGLGYLPQETSIFRGMTVAQNVMAVVELRERDGAKARATVNQLLEELHIEHLRDAPAISLSGGERRRVEIARALASEPSFMLLDEPFAALDEITRRALADDVLQLWAELKPAIVFVTHSVEEAVYMASRVVVLTRGPGRISGEMSIAGPTPRPTGFRTTAGFRSAVEAVSTVLAKGMEAAG